MKDIKYRMNVVDFFLSGAGHALYQPTTIESVCLQFRKMLELIVMASLVANKHEYTKTYDNHKSAWNAKYLLRDIARVNLRFYPNPVIEKPDMTRLGAKKLIGLPKEDYLTKKEFEKVYEKCGAIMHSGNPYGRKINYKYYERMIPIWRTKIMALLSTHTINLMDDSGTYLIHIREVQDDEVHWYRLEPE